MPNVKRDPKRDFERMTEVVKEYQRALQHMRYGPKDNFKGAKEGHYGFVPNLDPDVVLRMLIAIKEMLKKYSDTNQVKAQSNTSTLYPGSVYNTHTFLDAGCGCGNIMLLALAAGYCACGMDFDKKNVKIARDMLYRANRNMHGNGVIEGDLLKYRGYGDWKVIYYYQPMNNGQDMIAFQRRIAHYSTIGCIIMPFGSCNLFQLETKMFKKHKVLGRSVFRKISNNKKGDWKI